jgi:hypothetical protein
MPAELVTSVKRKGARGVSAANAIVGRHVAAARPVIPWRNERRLGWNGDVGYPFAVEVLL